jgi:hypothetical protein
MVKAVPGRAPTRKGGVEDQTAGRSAGNLQRSAECSVCVDH